MTTILVDHNMEGQAALLSSALAEGGWLEIVPLLFVTLADVGLHAASPDRSVWRFAQSSAMLLLTNNRNMTGEDSLERTMRDESTPASLPVLTIGNLKRFGEAQYRRRCAERLIEIVLDLDTFRGTRRLFIP